MAEPVSCTFVGDADGLAVGAPQIRVFDANGRQCGYTDLTYSDGVFYIEPGVYNVLVEYPGQSYDFLTAVIVRTDVEIAEGTEIKIPATEAVHEVTFHTVLPDGAELIPPMLNADNTAVAEEGNVDYERLDMFFYPMVEEPNLIFFKGLARTDRRMQPVVRFSDLPSSLCVSVGSFTPNGNNFCCNKYIVPQGLNTSVELKCDATQYVSSTFVSAIAASESDPICAGAQLTYRNRGDELSFCQHYRLDMPADTGITLWLNGGSEDAPYDILVAPEAIFSAEYTKMDNATYIQSNIISPRLEQYDGKPVLMANDVVAVNPAGTEEIVLGNEPLLFNGLSICKDYMSIDMELFTGRIGQKLLATFEYEAYFNNVLQFEGNEGRSPFLYDLMSVRPPFESGERRFVFTSRGPLGNSSDVTAISELVFDFDREDCAPPAMTLLSFVDDEGRNGSTFDVTEPVTVILQAGDWEFGIDMVKYTEIRKYAGDPEVGCELAVAGTDNWIEIGPMKATDIESDDAGRVFTAELEPYNLQEGQYDIRLKATDQAGNNTTQTLYRALTLTKPAGLSAAYADETLDINGNTVTVNAFGCITMTVTTLAEVIAAEQHCQSDGSATFTIPALNPGCYIVTVKGADGVIANRKIML